MADVDVMNTTPPESRNKAAVINIQLWIDENGAMNYIVKASPKEVSYSGGFGATRPPETELEKAVMMLVEYLRP